MPSLCYLCLGGPGDIRAPGYDVHVCAICWREAEPGWPRRYEPNLTQALSRAGLLIPDRNARGLWPRAYQPPADFNL